ncbi:ABC-2 family transporter protein [Tsukamurella sp. 8F]|uniref:ABC transporter permease n=1 Tax=unclassified Tsukamurella TaxID=2633480 RepID=UPI0023B8BEC0|nr:MULTISPECIES: ABC-2 family transporter protein [unclassified Tsukamurella]MDF0529597.1 ABC-2 family transporter protein [Tsukamurella sp. 8J]MDF0585715.1 ABC-2 family transporter protein [Tsukamurella sp. 8F]
MIAPTALSAYRRLLPYWRLTAAGFARQSTYLLAAAAGLTTNTVFAFLKMGILLATLRAAGGSAGGYTPELMVSYIFLSQGLLAAVGAFGGDGELAERVRTGDVAVDFLRPVDVQLANLADSVGGAVYSLIPRALPVVAVGSATGMMAWASEPIAYPLGAASLLASIVLGRSLLYCVAVLGFWLVEVRGIQLFYTVVSTFLMGMFVPIGMFPGWLQALSTWTPLGWILLPPCDILSGRVQVSDGVSTVGIQIAWVTATLVLGTVLTRAGRHRLEVQGG